MEDSRRILESCVNEFFAPQTSNDRKREIEVMMENFSQQHGSWKQALYFLSHSSGNQHVVWYCLTVIENAIKSRWVVMSRPEQTELKSTIYSFLIKHSSASSTSKCPHFVRNKMVKVLTDIGKFAWPHSYPDFIENVLDIAAHEDTAIVGLLFLKTISEEWPNVKDEVSTDRKIEIITLLVNEVKPIFDLFQRILMVGLKQKLSAPTPPPSPSDVADEDCIDEEPLSTFDEIIALTLETIAHYFSWVPLDGCITTSQNGIHQEVTHIPFTVEFLQLLCRYALPNGLPYKNKNNRLAVLAMAALNELLYRKYIPKEFDEHMKVVTSFATEVLNKILCGTGVPNLHHEYLEKVIDFLCLIASAHFFRYDVPTSKAFMTLLLPFTFRQDETNFYYECLEIWARLLDHLTAQVPFVSITATGEDLIETFKQPILGVATGIMQSTTKFSSLSNSDDLFETEDEEDADIPCLTRNIDVLVKIGELLPAESLQAVTSTWGESCRFFVGLQTQLNESKTVLNDDKTVQVDHFNFIVQLIGRVANVFYGDVFKQELALGKMLMQQLVGTAVISKNYYYVRNQPPLTQACCEILSALRTWSYWLSRYHSEVILAESTLIDQQNFFEMLSLSTEVVFFTLENPTAVDSSIVLAASTFFATLVNSIRTQYLFQIPVVRTLVEKIHDLRSSVDDQSFRMLNKSVACIVLLPWQNVSQQEWELRTQLYVSYMQKVLGDLYTHQTTSSEIVFWLNILNDQLDLLMSECTLSKKICWDVLKDAIPFMQRLSSVYLRQPQVSSEILNFFLKIMEVLRQQAGPQFFEESIRGFLNLFSSENLINDLMRETESSSVAIEKFLQMLQFMVKDPSPSFKKFLPDSLALCYDHIYPILAQRNSPDLKLPFFKFIRDAVNYRWAYFFPALPFSHTAPDSPTLKEQEAAASKRLEQVLQSIGHSFLQNDLEIFRYNIETLRFLNEKHQLNTKVPPVFLQQFLTVLLQVLLHKSHDLLRDEVAAVLHGMAIFDYSNFCKEFVPNFLNSNFPLLNVEHKESLCSKFKDDTQQRRGSDGFHRCVDLPSFTQYLSRFLDDLRYFYFYLECQRLSNQSSHTEDNHSSTISS